MKFFFEVWDVAWDPENRVDPDAEHMASFAHVSDAWYFARQRQVSFNRTATSPVAAVTQVMIVYRNTGTVECM